MTDKKRLEEIEAKYSALTISSEKNSTEYTEVDVEDLVFLIQTCWNATGGMTIDYESLTDRHVNITKEILEEYQEENERLEQQNKRYREALELLVKQETLGKDAKTGKTAVSYNGMIALKGLGIFNDDEYIVYGVDEVIESVLEDEE